MERVVQFETKQKTSPRFDMLAFYSLETGEIRKEGSTGAAWLSSARAVRCSIKLGNECNPCPVLHITGDCLAFGEEEGEADVKSAWPLYLGPHTPYNGEKQWVASK